MYVGALNGLSTMAYTHNTDIRIYILRAYKVTRRRVRDGQRKGDSFIICTNLNAKIKKNILRNTKKLFDKS